MWAGLLIATVTVLVYLNSLPAAFILDDQTLVTQNPRILHLWPPSETILQPTRWVADYTMALSYACHGMRPAGFRMVNIAVHVLAALLLFGIIRRTLELPRFGVRFARSSIGWAAACAALWAVHPLQTESVTYIAQRIEALMGLFYLLTAYAFIRSLSSPKPRGWADVAIAACLIGMGTKEVIVALPPALLMYDWAFAGRGWREVLAQRGRVHLTFFLCLGVLAMLLLLSAASQLALQGAAGSPLPRLQYAATEAGVILHYLRLAVVPYPQCLDYMWPLVQNWRDAVVPGVVVLALCGLSVWALVRRSPAGFLGCWFFMLLAPTSSINPIADAAVEHRMYLALAPCVILLVFGARAAALGLGRPSRTVAEGLPAAVRRGLVGAAIVVALLILSALTVRRNMDYRSAEVMWRQVLDARPSNDRARVELTTLLFQRGDYAGADRICRNLLVRLSCFEGVPLQELRRRSEKTPQILIPLRYYINAKGLEGNLAYVRGALDDAHTSYARVLEIGGLPDTAIAHENMALIALARKQPDHAEAHLRAALRLDARKGAVHESLADLLMATARPREAIEHYRAALRLCPPSPALDAKLTAARSAADRVGGESPAK